MRSLGALSILLGSSVLGTALYSCNQTGVEQELPGSQAEPDGSHRDGGSSRLACEVGTSDSETHLEFYPLKDGATIPMVGAGQSGLLVELGVRWAGMTRPSVSVQVQVQGTGRVSSTQPAIYDADASSRVSCDKQWCWVVPLLVRTQTLVDDPYDLARLPVDISVRFEQDADVCEATLSGFLERRDAS